MDIWHQLRRCVWCILMMSSVVLCGNNGDYYARHQDVLSRSKRQGNRSPFDIAYGLEAGGYKRMVKLGRAEYIRRHGPPPKGRKLTFLQEQQAIHLGKIELEKERAAEKLRKARVRMTVTKRPQPRPRPIEAYGQIDDGCQPELERPLVAYADMRVELDCQVCKRRALPKSASVRWEFRANGSAAADPLDDILDAAMSGFRFKDKKRRLVFAAIRPRNAGKYVCSRDGQNSPLGRYDITVISKPFFRMVFESRGDNIYTEETVSGFTLFTHWSEWTGCNHCGELGEKFRFGYCYVDYDDTDYPEGVPCRSNVLPEKHRHLFSRRRDEKIIRECEVACPEGHQGTSMSSSKVMETYFVDFDLGRPSLPPEVEEQVIYVDQGGSVELLCPGGGLQDAIRWQNGSNHVMQSELRTDRVTIDAMHVLRINGVMPHDAQVYTCYYNGVRVASMTVNVMPPLRVNKAVKSNLMYVGIALTGLVGLIIWASVYKNRKHHSFSE